MFTSSSFAFSFFLTFLLSSSPSLSFSFSLHFSFHPLFWFPLFYAVISVCLFPYLCLCVISSTSFLHFPLVFLAFSHSLLSLFFFLSWFCFLSPLFFLSLSHFFSFPLSYFWPLLSSLYIAHSSLSISFFHSHILAFFLFDFLSSFCASLPLPLSVISSTFLSLSVSICLPLLSSSFLSLPHSVSLTLSLSLSLYLHPQHSSSTFNCLSPFLSLSVCCLPLYAPLHVCLSVCLSITFLTSPSLSLSVFCL